MPFEFLNDDPELGPSGPSQPYESGSQDSFRRNLSVMGMEGSQGARPTAEKPDVSQDRVKVAKNHSTIESAYGQAGQILKTYSAQSPYDRFLSPISPKDFSDIDGLKSRVDADVARSKAAQHADDLRNLANRPNIAPEYAQQFLDAADSMDKAHVAQTELQSMRQPGGPLAASQPEQQDYANRLGQVNAQIADLTNRLPNAGAFQSQTLHAQINQLKQERDRLQAAAPKQGAPNVQPPDDAGTISTAAGTTREEYVKAMAEMSRIVGAAHGVPLSAPVTPFTFPIVYANMIQEIFNPEVAKRMLQDISWTNPKQAGQEGSQEPGGEGEEPPQGRMKPQPSAKSNPDPDLVSKKLEQDPRFQSLQRDMNQQEMRRRMVWKELAESGDFKNVGDVIGFVVASFLIGPRNAALVFSNMHHNGMLRQELDRLNHESAQLRHQQDSYIRLHEEARHHAALENQQAEALDERSTHDFQMEDLTRQYQKQRAQAGKGRDAVLDSLLHGARLHHEAISQLKDTLKETEVVAKETSGVQGYTDEARKKAQSDLPIIHQGLADYRAKLMKHQADIQKRLDYLQQKGLLNDDQRKDAALINRATQASTGGTEQ